MDAQVLDHKWPDTVGFARLHALVERGYRPLFKARSPQTDYAFVELVHPKKRGKNVPPSVTLWSDGIVSTSEILWPEKYVPTEEGPPDWQRFISPQDADRFENFTSTVKTPTVVDLYIFPALRESKIFAARLMLGSALCIVIAAALKLVTYLV